MQDVLANKEDNQKYTVTSTCNLDNLPQFRLEPGRGKAQHALVIVSAMKKDTIVIDQLQLLTDTEATAAENSLRQLILLARKMHFQQRKRGPHNWDNRFPPAIANKCRKLGRSPTGPAIDPAIEIEK